jgi:hypothetical protein
MLVLGWLQLEALSWLPGYRERLVKRYSERVALQAWVAAACFFAVSKCIDLSGRVKRGN